jgi:hypothetical protein
MWKRFWTVALALIFIISLASAVDAQSNNPGNGNQGENPGNGNQGNNGNGNQGENPGNGNRGNNGNGNQGENPGNGNGNRGENAGNGNQGEDRGNRGTISRNGHSRRTPDGMTPAEEDICDDLKGATRGLYGLCVAFCEAHDSECVPDFSLENPFRDCKKRDRKILEKYRQKMREGDPEMPCLPSAGEDPEFACPCWSQEDLEFFPFQLTSWSVSEAWLDCNMEADWSMWDEDDEGEMFLECEQYAAYIGESSALADGNEFHVDLSVSSGDCDGMYCTGFVGCMGDTCPDELKGRGEFIIDVNQEEYANCKAAIEQLSVTYCH